MTAGDMRATARAMARAARESGSPLSWFDELYEAAGAGRAVVPWADGVPDPHLVSWWARTPLDIVFEAYTVQVLPPGPAERAAAIASLRALTGRDLLVVARGRTPDEPEGEMPWPLTEAEVRAIAGDGLEEQTFEDFCDDEEPPKRRFRAHLRRVTMGGAPA